MSIIETPQRKVKGIWIPIEIWETKELTLQQKVFLAEIDSLSNNEAGCWASNAWFAEQFGISQDRASRVISSLVALGLISLTLRYKENSKEVIRRTLKILRPLPVKTPIPPGESTGRGPGESTGRGPGRNTEDRIYKKENTKEKDFGAAASQPSPVSSFEEQNIDLEVKNKPSINSNENPPKQTKKKTSKSTKKQISPTDRIKAERILSKFNDCLKIFKQKTKQPPTDGWKPLDQNIRVIVDRLIDGYVYKDFIKIIETKIHDPWFIERPALYVPTTLFGADKFEKYRHEDPTQYKKQSSTNKPSNGSGYTGTRKYKEAKVVKNVFTPWED